MDEVHEVNIRLLEANEYDNETLKEIFAAYKVELPSPLESKILIAENNKKEIVGFYTLQTAYHAEPIWVREDFRNTLLHERLMNKMYNSLKHLKGLRIFVLATNDKITRLAERFGFKKLSHVVLTKEF